MTEVKRPAKPKLTDAERYKQFLDAAKAAGASDNPEDFDRAFAKVVKPNTVKTGNPSSRS